MFANTNRIYATNQTGIFVLTPGSCPRVGLGGAKGVKYVFFFEHGYVAYQVEGDDEKNRQQVFFIPVSKW